MQECGKGIKLWQSVQIAVRRPVLEGIAPGQIKAPDGLSALTYRLLQSMKMVGRFVKFYVQSAYAHWLKHHNNYLFLKPTVTVSPVTFFIFQEEATATFGYPWQFHLDD